MIKQEKIREGIAEYLWENRAGETTVQDWVDTWAELPEMNKEGYREDAGAFMIYLHSQGVVIKVDRELPERILDVLFYLRLHGKERTQQLKELLENEAGYVAVEPLIEEKK